MSQIRAPQRLLKPGPPLAILVALLFSANSYVVDVTGIVTTKSGEPLKGVIVLSTGRVARTDDQGHYVLREPGRVILFGLYNYKPLTKVLDPGTAVLDVVLEDSTATEWIAPSCSKSSSAVKRIGLELQFVKPKNGAVKKITDADYTEYLVGYGPKQSRQLLQVWSGPNVTDGVPREAMVTQSAELTERALKCGSHSGGQGVDLRGRFPDGRSWRWVRYPPYALASYENASEAAARFFDRIIDGFCCGGD